MSRHEYKCSLKFEGKLIVELGDGNEDVSEHPIHVERIEWRANGRLTILAVALPALAPKATFTGREGPTTEHVTRPEPTEDAEDASA